MLLAGSPCPPAGPEEYRGCGARRGGEVRARLGARLPGAVPFCIARCFSPGWDGVLSPCRAPGGSRREGLEVAPCPPCPPPPWSVAGRGEAGLQK